MTIVPIALTFDGNYAPMAGVFIRSLLETKSPDTAYRIYAFAEKMDGVDRQELFRLLDGEDAVSLHIMTISADRYEGLLDKDRHMTASTFIRLHLASLLPQYDKILYLDVDMICCGDLAELYNTDMTGMVYAAAPETNHMLGMAAGGWQRAYYVGEHGWSEEKLLNYRQAGVLVLNLAMIRERRFERIFEDAAKQKYKMMDQDILNACVPSEQIVRLHMRWNLVSAFSVVLRRRENIDMDFVAEYVEAFEAPKIIHWAGKSKPWNSIGETHSLHHRFWDVAMRTPWYHRLLLGCNRVIAERAADAALAKLK